MKNTTFLHGFFAAALAASALSVSASTIPMATVPVSNAGNAADTNTGGLYGEVDYNYNIATYDVTLDQYTAFLNAVAATDTYGLYNPNLATDLNVAGISQSGSPGSFHYAVIGDGQRPVTYVSWYDAVRFVNWLGTGNTESGAYSITGGSVNGGAVTVPTTAQRASWAGDSVTHWYLPSESEWYKAAYFDPNILGSNKYWIYPIKSNTAPSGDAPPGGANSANVYGNNGYAVTQSKDYSFGQNYLTDVGAFGESPGPFGTFDQGGDVQQWNDLNAAVPSSFLGDRGGVWLNGGSDYSASSNRFENPALGVYPGVGFRVASSIVVAEPGSLILAFSGIAALLAWRQRRNA